jgi:hypothetical protein
MLIPDPVEMAGSVVPSKEQENVHGAVCARAERQAARERMRTERMESFLVWQGKACRGS